MGYEVFTIPDLPGRVLIGRDAKYIPGGAFCLNFGQPLVIVRPWHIGKWRFGPIEAYGVPIIHQDDDKGGYSIVVEKVVDGCFPHLRRLWDQHFPERYPHRPEFEGLKIIAEFALQFPEFAKPPG